MSKHICNGQPLTNAILLIDPGRALRHRKNFIAVGRLKAEKPPYGLR
jgi:hypothetical protein